MKHGGKRKGAGRRPIYEKTKLTQIRVSQDIWDAIPSPKAAWVREAIEEKAKRDNLTTNAYTLRDYADNPRKEKNNGET